MICFWHITGLNIKLIITIWPLLHLGLYVIREFQIRVYREPLTAGGHVTSLSRHI